MRAECVALLLKHGADPNVRDQLGQVPLMLAAKSGMKKVLDHLLECPKTDRHAVDPAGWTVSKSFVKCISESRQKSD